MIRNTSHYNQFGRPRMPCSSSIGSKSNSSTSSLFDNKDYTEISNALQKMRNVSSLAKKQGKKKNYEGALKVIASSFSTLEDYAKKKGMALQKDILQSHIHEKEHIALYHDEVSILQLLVDALSIREELEALASSAK